MILVVLLAVAAVLAATVMVLHQRRAAEGFATCRKACDSDLLRPDRPCMTGDGERCCKKRAGSTTLTDCMFKSGAGTSSLKVRLWSDDGHAGFSRVYGPGRYSTLGNMSSMGVSSLQVPAGLRVVAYADTGLRGESTQFSTSAKTLGPWNNRIKSMAVIKV